MFQITGKHIRAAVLLFAAIALTAFWRYTPLAQYLQAETLQAAGKAIQAQPWGTAGLFAAFVGAGLLLLPINLLIFALSMVFSPGQAFAHALAGSIVMAAAGYAAGYWWWPAGHQRMEEGFRAWLQRRGLFSLIVLRNVPMGPFTAVNVAAGAIRLRFGRFMLATALGMIPGIAAIVLAGRGLLTGSPRALAAGILGILAVAAAGRFVIRRITAESTFRIESTGEVATAPTTRCDP